MAEPGDRLVVGLSGGMDSICLVYLLKDLGYLLEAVHVNHQIRGEEADKDEFFVRELCKKNNIPFHGFSFNVPLISKEQHLSEEEAGRMVRREAFAKVLKDTGAKAVALAHHGNDGTHSYCQYVHLLP